ncbi:hypothetical protein HDV00_001968 [Rhizophlyctis rosea]|nr:hypothetical protein HDV00_001968 [Rhizophlyctis rosea]
MATPHHRPVNATCMDIPDPPATYNDETSRKAWHDWLKTYAHWNHPNLTIKEITNIRTHTWMTSHPEYSPHFHHTVRYLYHGTPSRNVQSIVTNGFHGCTYMATNPAISIPYSMKEQNYSSYQQRRRTEGTMILSCVLVRMGEDSFNLSYPDDRNVAIMKSSKRIVPIAVIKFEHQYY